MVDAGPGVLCRGAGGQRVSAAGRCAMRPAVDRPPSEPAPYDMAWRRRQSHAAGGCRDERNLRPGLATQGPERRGSDGAALRPSGTPPSTASPRPSHATRTAAPRLLSVSVLPRSLTPSPSPFSAALHHHLLEIKRGAAACGGRTPAAASRLGTLPAPLRKTPPSSLRLGLHKSHITLAFATLSQYQYRCIYMSSFRLWRALQCLDAAGCMDVVPFSCTAADPAPVFLPCNPSCLAMRSLPDGVANLHFILAVPCGLLLFKPPCVLWGVSGSTSVFGLVPTPFVLHYDSHRLQYGCQRT